MNTLPTIEVRPEGEAGWPIVVSGPIWTDLHGSPALDGEMDSGFYSLVYQPDGLVLVREDCGTCHGSGVESCPHGLMEEHGGDEHLQPCPGAGLCPDCLGVPLLAWYRECDRCDQKGEVREEEGDYLDATVFWLPCPAKCVEIDGRRLVKVRRNP